MIHYKFNSVGVEIADGVPVEIVKDITTTKNIFVVTTQFMANVHYDAPPPPLGNMNMLLGVWVDGVQLHTPPDGGGKNSIWSIDNAVDNAYYTMHALVASDADPGPHEVKARFWFNTDAPAQHMIVNHRNITIIEGDKRQFDIITS